MNKTLADIQKSKACIERKIKKVGIRNVPTSVWFDDKVHAANVSCYVSLKEQYKGIHMSRLVEAVYIYTPLRLCNVSDLVLILQEFKVKNEEFSEEWYFKVGFSYLYKVQAPVSKRISYIDCNIKISSEQCNESFKWFVEIIVPYVSCCPCSKSISEYNAHNQRSEIGIKVQLMQGIDIVVLVKDIIEMIQDCASSPIYGVLKREDEKYVTEKMYENPVFVEDMVRKVADNIDKGLLDKKISDYVLVAEHFESIHQHNALAILNCGRELQ